jgi:hypothetical protein
MIKPELERENERKFLFNHLLLYFLYSVHMDGGEKRLTKPSPSAIKPLMGMGLLK